MTKRRRRRPVSTDASPPTPSPTPRKQRSFGEPELLAIFAAAICLIITWFFRALLNPDGVSYLDLARLVRIGDWDGYVQGYWSPLYPAIIAALSLLTTGSPLALVILAHVVNGMAAIAGIALLWWWGRQTRHPFVTRTLLATFLLASTGLPRIEAVTPDVLLQGLMVWIGYELVFHRDRRPVASGVALGLAFLGKTSVWPWLLLSLPFRLWGAGDRDGRRRVFVSSGVALLVAAVWIVPLSVKAGHLNAGTAGRLNYGWYIEGSNARTPDTDTGRHRAYQEVVVDPTHRLDLVDFVSADRWTYAPWSDPTAWDAGIETSNAKAPEIGELLAYWGRQARRTFGFWMLPVLLGVLLPCAVAFWRPGLASSLTRTQRPTLVAFLLGLAGIVQFVLIHSEPRLIAPFVLLLGLAALQLFFAAPLPNGPSPAIGRNIATAIGLLGVVWMAGSRINIGIISNAQVQTALASILHDSAVAPPTRGPWGRVAVAGPALPVAPAAFMAGAHIVAQLPPRSLTVAQSLPPDRQRALLLELFAGKADVAWVSNRDGGVKRVPIPPR